MLSQERAFELVQESLNSLHRVGLLAQSVSVRDDTILLGTGSFLDSVAFVTFVTDMEDRLLRETSQELYIVLSEISGFNSDSAYLTVDALTRYIVSLTKK